MSYDKFLGYVDYFIEFLEKELDTIIFLRNHVPFNLLESPKTIETLLGHLRRERTRLAVDSEIVLLTVLPSLPSVLQNSIEEVSQSCFLLCVAPILPEKYTLPHKDPDLENLVRNIIDHPLPDLD